jgi:hypothetical protein
VDVLFVKGASLGTLTQRDPFAKTSWDIDLLVAPDMQKCAGRLLKEAGYALVVPAGLKPGRQLDRWLEGNRESAWHNAARGTTVELHTALADSGAIIPRIGMSSPRQAVAIGGVSVPTLATEELFAFLSVHGMSHRWARLKWLADVAALAMANYSSIGALRAAAVEKGAGRCADVALLLCANLFGLGLPQDLATDISSDGTTRKLAALSLQAMDQIGDPRRRLSAATVREIWAAMRIQFMFRRGANYKLRTFWSHWTRPYAPSQAIFPRPFLPIVMIGWLPIRLLSRGFRKPSVDRG